MLGKFSHSRPSFRDFGVERRPAAMGVVAFFIATAMNGKLAQVAP